jgi:uncharacterized membrane protein
MMRSPPFPSSGPAASARRAWSALAPVVAAYAAASAAGLALLAMRRVVTGHVTFYYLPWNLALAWIPFGLALMTLWLVESRSPRRWLLPLCGGAWLLFFPNAPYLCTDLVHLVRLRPVLSAPLWFDLLVNLTFAVTGLMLGFGSLAIMQRLVTRARGRLAGWLFALTALALAGFGVYLGRFLRWSSWDALFSPLAVLADVAGPVIAPFEHLRAWGFSAVCALFLLLGYLMCQALSLLQPEATAGSGPPPGE